MAEEKTPGTELAQKKAPEKQAPIELSNLELSGQARTELSLLPQCKNFSEVFQLCNWIASSKIVPEAYRDRPADIFVAAEYGADIGLKFMTAVQNIAIIGGRPALPSDIKLAMVRSRNLLEDWEEATEEEARKTGKSWCRMKRVGVARPVSHTFSVEEAKTAGLWERRGTNNYPTPWVLHPYRMLCLKPRDKCLRDLFGDVFKGLHSVEEARDIELIEQQQSAPMLIEQASQPETKGREILEAPKPPLTSTELKPTERPQGATKETAAPSSSTTGALAKLIDERCATLRATPAGSAALMQLWSASKLPVAKFGKVEASSLLSEEQRPGFNDQLTDVLIALQSGGRK